LLLKKTAVLLVGYGEVPAHKSPRDFYDYNHKALTLLAGKFLPNTPWSDALLTQILSWWDHREWEQEHRFQSPYNWIFEKQRIGVERYLQAEYGRDVQVFKAFNFCDGFLPEQVLTQIQAQGFERLVLFPLLVIDSAFTTGITVQQVNQVLNIQDFLCLPSFTERSDYHDWIGTFLTHQIIQTNGIYNPSQVGLVLMTYGSPLETRGYDTGIRENQSLYEAVRQRLVHQFPLISIGWLNHNIPVGWTRPDVNQAAENLLHLGAKTLVFCPIGSATDNHETLLDLGRTVRRLRQRRIPCTQLPCPNDDPGFLKLLVRWLSPLITTGNETRLLSERTSSKP
jgi:protoporphyrin/coproporphyrin ferrochelatase